MNDEPPISFVQYLQTSHFGEATFENWESEFLQMGMYVILTVKLVQRGSAESKPLDESVPQDESPENHVDDRDAPWPVRRGGVWLALYKRSLSLAFLTLFLVLVSCCTCGQAAVPSTVSNSRPVPPTGPPRGRI